MVNNIQGLAELQPDRQISLICKDLFQHIGALSDKDSPKIEEISRIAREALQPLEVLEQVLPVIEKLPPSPSLIAASNRCLACFYNRVSKDVQSRIIAMSPLLALCKQLNIKISADVLENEAAMIAVVKQCAAKDGRRTALNIKNFGITDLFALIEIATICADRDAEATACYIQKFGITDQAALIKIATICADQDGEATALNIKNFGITDQADLIEIATICADQDAVSTARYMQDFGITDQADLIEIATICAAQNGGSTACYIKNFGITDPAALHKIAKICAANKGGRTALYIQNFGIADQAALIEIAKICAAQNGGATAQYMQNFGIKDLSALIAIATICVMQDRLDSPRYIDRFGIPLSCIIPEILPLSVIEDPQTLTALSQTVQNLPDLANFIALHLPNCQCEWVVNYLSNIKDPHACREATVSITAALLILRENLNDDQLKWTNEEGLIQAIYKLHAPNLYLPLVEQLVEFCYEDSFDAFNKIDLNISPSHFKLFRMLFAQLTAQGIDKNPMIDFFKVSKNKKIFKDAVKAKLLIKVLLNLIHTSDLTPDQKRAVLEKIDSYEAAVTASIIFDLKAEELLQDSSKGLADVSQQAVKGLLPLEGVENLADRLEKTFGASRYPQALWQYAAKMNTLDDPKVKHSLVEYASFVLNGTFEDERYNLEKNPHLAKLEEACPKIVDHWRKGIKSDSGAIDTDDPYLLFFCGTDVDGSCQRIDGDPSKNRGLLGYLMNGQTRLLAVVNDVGRIQARSLLRLLWDGEKPVLFLEGLFGDEALEQKILNLAKAKAQEMGLTLTRIEREGIPYGKSLQSLGSRAPFEYCDGVLGMTDGVFAIPDAVIVDY